MCCLDCAGGESGVENRCSSMFKASPLGCHLLLGNAALIILGGLIAPVNGLGANDIKPAATGLQNVASVRRSANAYLPQLNSFNVNFNRKRRKEDTHADWNAERPNSRSTSRLRRDSPADESSNRDGSRSINQPDAIRSDSANEPDPNRAGKISSGRPLTPT